MVHTFETVAGSCGPGSGVSAPAQSAESWVEPQSEIKMAKNDRSNDIWGVFVCVTVVSLK